MARHLKADDKLTARVLIKLSPNLLRQIDRAAAREGVTRSEFLRLASEARIARGEREGSAALVEVGG